mmetsp:Transcript_7834/g.25107  ORF Transcript_7834/g.25107 Transcript_7834/m.25107 type:complete len:215 (-) Transcript_7834:393-1037(-)
MAQWQRTTPPARLTDAKKARMSATLSRRDCPSLSSQCPLKYTMALGSCAFSSSSAMFKMCVMPRSATTRGSLACSAAPRYSQVSTMRLGYLTGRARGSSAELDASVRMRKGKVDDSCSKTSDDTVPMRRSLAATESRAASRATMATLSPSPTMIHRAKVMPASASSCRAAAASSSTLSVRSPKKVDNFTRPRDHAWADRTSSILKVRPTSHKML